MWIIHPVNIFTFFMFLFSVLADSNNTNAGNTACDNLHLFLYGIICFLAVVVLILLVLLFKMFTSMQRAIKRDAIHTNSDTRESTALCQNNALSLSPTSGDGADNSSSTSSGTPAGSLSDISTRSQRYVSLEDRRKTSDYINVSETASFGLVDLKKMDYVNVKETQQKKVKSKVQVRCDDCTTSISSDDSAVNYSKVVFTKADKSK